MGFFDFLKRKEENIEVENVRLDKLEIWLQNKQKSNEEKEKALLNLTKQKISDLTKELEQELDALKNIDWDKKKAEERIMLVVRENLNNYIILLSKLNDSLKNLDEKTYHAFIGRLNFIFADFGKRSFINSQKATFLIGKEVEDVKESINSFFRGLKEILENNKNFIETSKAVSFLFSEYNQTGSIEKIKSDIYDKIKKIEQKKADLEGKIESIEKDIKKIIESREYSEKIMRKEEFEKKQNALKQYILKLKEFIDLKSLARTFHESEKKMKIIREYGDDFYGAFENDECKSLINLVESTKKKHLNEMLAEIHGKKQEIEAFSEKDETAPLNAEIEKIKDEIESLGKEKSDNLKRIQRLEEKKQELLERIKQKLAEINVKVE